MAYLSADKAQVELQESIRKATSPEVTAPKQKHIRKCIVYTWDHHTSAVIWSAMKVQPILANPVQAFKAIITVHKIIKDGHPIVLKDAYRETGWLESIARSMPNDGSSGYGDIIRRYVALLIRKLEYHHLHPEFNGTFGYEEYISLKNIDDPNEGYATIDELMALQKEIDTFQKRVFATFESHSNNECKISSLVPLVEESYGIYTFVVSMLRALHKRTDAADALAPLREKFNEQHYKLNNFYDECRNLRYLTSLINVPTLSRDPPSLIDASTPKLPGRPKEIEAPPEPEPVVDFWSQKQAEQAQQTQRDYEAEQRRLEQQRRAEEERRRQEELQAQRDFEERQRQQQEYQRQAQEALMRQQMQQQHSNNIELQQLYRRINELEMQLQECQNRYNNGQMMLEQYDRRVKALEHEIVQVNENARLREKSKDDLIQTLQDEIAMWKSKYDALAKLYSQLRIEHLELLDKYKKLQVLANSAETAKVNLESMKSEMRAKNNELADLIRERDRARNDLARLKGDQNSELERLQRELRESRDEAYNLNKSKNNEVSALLAKFEREKAELEASLREKQALIDEFLSQLEGQQGAADHIRAEKDEEIAVLKASIDECLAQLADLQDNSANQEEVERVRMEKDEEIALLQATVDECVSQLDELNIKKNDQIGDLVDQEMASAALAINAATARIQELINQPQNPNYSDIDIQVHRNILDNVLALTRAIVNLIQRATESQNEIVEQGRGTASKAEFYKKNNRWTEGLISAAKAVAVATNLLVETADGVISKTHSLEQLIVASRVVSAATVQLVAASRVRSSYTSVKQQKLEDAAKLVKNAVDKLVEQVTNIVGEKAANNSEINADYNNMPVHEFKLREMEQQVKILQLDTELTNARRVLAKMRRSGYHTEETD